MQAKRLFYPHLTVTLPLPPPPSASPLRLCVHYCFISVCTCVCVKRGLIFKEESTWLLSVVPLPISNKIRDQNTWICFSWFARWSGRTRQQQIREGNRVWDTWQRIGLGSRNRARARLGKSCALYLAGRKRYVENQDRGDAWARSCWRPELSSRHRPAGDVCICADLDHRHLPLTLAF